MNLRTKILPIAAVPENHVEAMFAIFRNYYDHVDLSSFQRDLSRKTYLISLYDADRLVGFSTAYVDTLPGVNATVIFSGDTVLEKAYWGSKILQLAFYKLMWRCYLMAPWRPIYWMLMSKGYKTYLLMRRNFPNSYPNYLGETPAELRNALQLFYQSAFGDSFDPKTSLIAFAEPRGQLKRGVAEPSAADLNDPEIAFFQNRNPSAIEGVELACIAKLTFVDLLRSGLKHVLKWSNVSKKAAKDRAQGLHEPNVPVAPVPTSLVPHEIARKANPLDLLRAGLFEWFAILVVWALMVVAPAWLYPVAFLVIAGRFQAMGALLHDACHLDRITGIKNGLLNLVCGYPICSTIEAMRYHHLRHHSYFGSAQDPYFKPKAASMESRRGLASLWGIVVVIAWWVRPFFGLLARFDKKYKNPYAKRILGDRTEKDLSDSAQVDRCLREDVGQIVYQVILLAVAIALPKAFFLYYLLPLMFAGCVNAYRVMSEHRHDISGDLSPEAVTKNTFDQAMGPVTQYLFFPRRIGFHRMHHLHPRVRYEDLPKLQRWYAARTILQQDTVASASGERA